MDKNPQLQWLRAQLENELGQTRQTVNRLAADLSQGLERTQGNLRFVEQLVGGFIEISEDAQAEVARRLEQLEQRMARLEGADTG